jgi:hypothetical protein
MQQDDDRAGVANAARRILKDSGRFLLSSVKAALSGGGSSATLVLDAWLQGNRELHLDRVSLGTMVYACLARQTELCADKGIDLLVEGEQLPEALLDAGKVEAAVEGTIDAARVCCAQNKPLRVRTTREPRRALVSVLGLVDGDLPAAREGTHLHAARAILAAHGGDLAIECRDGQLAFTLWLPVEEPASAS